MIVSKKRTNSNMPRDPITGRIAKKKLPVLTDEAREHLMERTDNGKKLIDWGLKILNSRNVKDKKGKIIKPAAANSTKIAVWKELMAEARRGNEGMIGGDVNLTQIIINLGNKIKKRQIVEGEVNT